MLHAKGFYMALEKCDYIYMAEEKIADLCGAYCRFACKTPDFNENDVNHPLVKAKKAIIEIRNVKLHKCNTIEDVQNLMFKLKEYETIMEKYVRIY